MTASQSLLGASRYALALLLVAALANAGQAAIVKLKLGDITPGTEVVTLVPNGDFEDNSSGNDFDANGWGRFGNMFYDAPVPVPNTGSSVARFHVDGGGAGGYTQVLSLSPDTDYVLSAYIGHLGDSTHGSRAELDLGDAAGEPNDGVMGGGSISVSQLDDDANSGYFVYGTFSTTDTGTTPNLRAFFVTGGEPTTGWAFQPVAAIWDNIAVTPASVFVPPTAAIPEPTALAMLFSLAACAIASRR